MPEKLSTQSIRAAMASPVAVEVLESVDSTNTEAKRRIAAGWRESEQPTPLLLLAETQTGGRGRLGRSFSSPQGAGLYMSLLLFPDRSPKEVLAITSAAAVAVCLAIESLTDLRPQIKWVNDVYLSDKKLCGILTEGVTDPADGRLSAMIVGIGVNCTAASLPPEVAAIATSLEREGALIDRNRLAAAICDRLLTLYGTLTEGDWLPLYRERSWLDGQRVTCTRDGERIEGVVLGIAEDGALLLATEEGTVRIATGEATVRKVNE
ncbi:MAG: biotin--[Clostridia bacterium]|nr:biotin--[acetyl-CoA-carboxylase] ligase [Clostridia bacterium]